MPIIVLILLSLTGGFAYVSKSALPGDMLYPVKTSIDEPIEEALAFGPQAQSVVHINHASVRLREIEQLKSQGRLSRRDPVFTKFAFENEIGKVNADIEKLNNSNDYQSARQVEMTLRGDLKKSSVLATLYDKSATAAAGDNSFAAGGPLDASSAAGMQSGTPTTGAGTQTPTVHSSTTKYVPKLLPQRSNIQRGDDGGGEDD
jgi:hypothetical protein